MPSELGRLASTMFNLRIVHAVRRSQHSRSFAKRISFAIYESGSKQTERQPLEKGSYLMSKVKKFKPFDKYYYYNLAVQSPDNDVNFLKKLIVSSMINAETMREDFCGTFALSCAWARRNPSFRAFGIDNDPEPIEYGKKNYLGALDEDQQNRVEVSQLDVLSKDLPSSDIVCALNFSYFCFKTRSKLSSYLKSVHESLNSDGIAILDCFGGAQCQYSNEEEIEHSDHNFSYFWDQDSFDPVSNHAKFYIHFKRRGEARQDRVFSYDWRMWSIPEIREMMEEAGFREVHVYWEENDEDGEGNGEFSRVDVGEECDAWVAYVVGKK